MQFRAEVAGVTFSSSDSAPVPKFLNPGLDPAIRDDHYPVCRLDIRKDSEFATG